VSENHNEDESSISGNRKFAIFDQKSKNIIYWALAKV
jgi:hypothetical protein